MDQNQSSIKSWRTSWWGILVLIALWPFTLVWLIWRPNKLSMTAKGALTIVWCIIPIAGLMNTPQPSAVNTASTNTATVKPVTPVAEPPAAAPEPATSVATSPSDNQASTPKPDAPKTFAFDIPSLIGLKLNQIIAKLGKPIDDAPTDLQASMTSTWNRTFNNAGRELIVDYYIATGKVQDLFVDAPDGLSNSQSDILAVGNLEATSSKYTTKFVDARSHPGFYTGVTVTPIK